MNAGWNLIGYDGAINTSLSNAVFNNGTSYTWAQAIAANAVQAYLAYYDNNAQDNLTRFKYLSSLSGLDDTAFRRNKGYWIYANSSGNLTLPSVGGTTSGQTYAWSDLRFSNGTDEMNVTDAGSAGWLTTTLQHSDANGVFKTVCSPNNIPPCDDTSFSSWKGYFVKSSIDNLTLIRQN